MGRKHSDTHISTVEMYQIVPSITIRAIHFVQYGRIAISPFLWSPMVEMFKEKSERTVNYLGLTNHQNSLFNYFGILILHLASHGKPDPCVIIIYYFRTLVRSLEPVVTECKEHTIRTQTKTNG